VRVCPGCDLAVCADCDDGQPCDFCGLDEDDEEEICPAEEWAEPDPLALPLAADGIEAEDWEGDGFEEIERKGLERKR
jgi:hypothetical protein